MTDFSHGHAATFDAVTAFQVLEHLSEVVPITPQAATWLKAWVVSHQRAQSPTGLE
jgi:hypothetical protein